MSIRFHKKAALCLFIAQLISCSAIASPKNPLPVANPQQLGFSQEGLKRIDAFFADEIAHDRMPGAILAVARKGKLVIYRSYGYLNKANKTPMRFDAIFNLASMTKPMVTVGALTFYEEGKLPLNAPIANWFPQFKDMKVGQIAEDGKMTLVPAKGPIKIEDLMRHTNGLTYGGRGDTQVHQQYPTGSSTAASQYDGTQFINKLASLPLLYEPGTVWNYGFGLDVMGLIEEKIANKPLDTILRERIWNKVGMPNTGFHIADKDRSRLAQPLPLDPLTGKPQKIDILTMQVHFDCGGSCAFATAGDYLRFGQMLLNGGIIDGKRILSPQTVAFMTSNHIDSNIKIPQNQEVRAGYGFGLGVQVRKEKGLAAINGNTGDYNWNGANGTMFWVDPKEQMVVVMMAATPGQIRNTLREQVTALVYGALNN
jgi:CubicO group peptidase (beta-lactamase class C family)